MTDNRTTELESLSKLKMAGRLRYWRGTIEIPETELHAICDEIQAEHEQAVAVTLGKPNATSNQESIVRSFLRKISPNRDWDYLGEHEHAMIADLVDDIAAALGSCTLTAEQVADAVLENFEETHETRYDHWEPSTFDWQAIADELNAELGRRNV